MRGTNGLQATYSSIAPGPMRVGIVALVAAVGVTAGALVTGLLGGAAPATEATHSHVGYISLDSWYNTQDPKLVFGEASFVMVGRITDEVRIDGDRTVFDVEVERELKGSAPSTVRVSQLGYVSDETVEVEGMSLMQPGRSYVMALSPPSASEAQDALIVLTAPEGGNVIEVDGPDDARVAKYVGFVRHEKSPYPAGETAYSDLKRLAENWVDGRPGYSTPGPVRPGG